VIVVRAAFGVDSTGAARSTYSETVAAKQEGFIRFLEVETGETTEEN
jgi:hypothetical protein